MTRLLLIIDMQEGFRYKESEAILPNILKLTERFGGKVIFSVFIDRKDSMFETQLHWNKFQNPENQELFSELKAVNHTIVTHDTYTVFTKELQDFIHKNNIGEIYLCGIYTDVCIIKTAMDLFDAGKTVFVIEDACNSLHGQDNHRTAIDSLKHILGKSHVTSINSLHP